MTDFSSTQMQALTHTVLDCMDDWKISAEEMLSLLGLSDAIRPRQLNSYRNGDRSFPPESDVLQRIDHITGITDALRTTFPFSNQMRVMWLQKPHRRFQKRTPLSVMLDEGADGLQKVRVEVDCTYGYAINDALHARQQGKT